MNAQSSPPRWYWIASAVAFCWMAFGVVALTMDFMLDEAALAAMTEGQRQLYESRPAWITAVYAIAVVTGFLGALGLLLRQAWSVPALGTSLAAVAVQFAYTLVVMDAIGVLGAAAAVPFPLVIFAFGAATLWLARHAVREGWIPTQAVADTRSAAAA